MLSKDEMASLLALPWTVHVTHDADNGFVARVAEMPDAIATGDTPEELEADFWESLRASLEARTALGDPIPRPPYRVFTPRSVTRLPLTTGAPRSETRAGGAGFTVGQLQSA